MNNQEEFEFGALTRHGDEYSYHRTEYVDDQTPVIIYCGRHGNFEMTPDDHILKGYRCPKCALDQMESLRQQDMLRKKEGERMNVAPIIDCCFSIELSARTHCQAYMNELVMSTNPYHLQGWTEHEVRTIFGYIGKPLSNSPYSKDHVEAAKALEAKFNKALTEAYGKDQETYVYISMEYHLNTCTYRFNVEDYGIDNLQAENVTLGDCEPLPHWSLFRVLYAKK